MSCAATRNERSSDDARAAETRRAPPQRACVRSEKREEIKEKRETRREKREEKREKRGPTARDAPIECLQNRWGGCSERRPNPTACAPQPLRYRRKARVDRTEGALRPIRSARGVSTGPFRSALDARDPTTQHPPSHGSLRLSPPLRLCSHATRTTPHTAGAAAEAGGAGSEEGSSLLY